jgi:hypothetical protein
VVTYLWYAAIDNQNKTRAIELATKIAAGLFLHTQGSNPMMSDFGDLPEYEPPELEASAPPESLPDRAGEDDLVLEAYKRQAERRLVDELLDVIRQANAPRPLVILEREQADYLRNLILDLVAGNESARYAVGRLRIGLDLLDGRTRA